MLTTFSFGVFFKFVTTKEPNSRNYKHIFSRNNHPRKYVPTISTAGLFCYGKFEETPNEKGVNMSEVTKPYFNCLDPLFQPRKISISTRVSLSLDLARTVCCEV